MFKIYDGRGMFYQWDLNRKLLVEDSSITQVHFYNKNRETALPLAVYELDGQRVVDVPNELLQDASMLYAYAYLDDHTKMTVTFTVKSRPKPEEYEYTETEVLTFSKMMERAEDAADAADISAGNAAASERLAKGYSESADLAARAAAGSADQAAQSEGNAGISERNARNAESNANTSAVAAHAAKVAAETARAAAEQAAGKAAASEQNARNAEQNAGTHETGARNAQTQAEAAAKRAESAADNVGGSGVDVTAAVGQTIIVKEVDENGKPTAWEAVDRTHWSEETVGDLVPRTVFQAILHPQFDVYFYALPEFGLAAGKQYTVIFDDNEYNCTAVAATFDGMDIVTIGNTFFVDGVQSSEPFVVAKIPVMGATIVISLSLGYANTIQIIGEKTVYHTLPEYAPNEYWVSFLQTGVASEDDWDDGSFKIHFSADWYELIAAIKAGKNIYANTVNGNAYSRFMLGHAEIGATPSEGFEWTDMLVFSVCHNAGPNYSFTGDENFFVMRWTDGTVTVSGKHINVQPT